MSENGSAPSHPSDLLEDVIEWPLVGHWGNSGTWDCDKCGETATN